MTALDADALAAIRARAAAATPWTPADCDLRTDDDGEAYAVQGATIGGTLISLGDSYEGSDEDWLFIAHARTDVPALLAHIDALHAAHAAAIAAARADALREARAACGALRVGFGAMVMRGDVMAGECVRAIDALARGGA